MTLVLVAAAVAVVAGIAIALLIGMVMLQTRTIRMQRQAIDTLKRAESRQRARGDILHAELAHLSRTAQLVTMWRPRKVGAS